MSDKIEREILQSAGADVSADEVERRIMAARAEAAEVHQTQEFLDGLTNNDELVKPVYNPEAYAFRSKYTGHARRGELKPTACKHPLNRLEQYIDDDPLIRRAGRPVNLFECGVCHMPIWLVDPWGVALADD